LVYTVLDSIFVGNNVGNNFSSIVFSSGNRDTIITKTKNQMETTSKNAVLSVKDLRIGNLVNGYYTTEDYADTECLCEIVLIDSVGHTEYSIWVDSKAKSEMFDEFKGVPVTEELLLRFGFNWSVLHQAYHKDGFAYDLNVLFKGGYSLSTFKRGHILIGKLEYAHQLQNLYFALTNTELTLK